MMMLFLLFLTVSYAHLDDTLPHGIEISSLYRAYQAATSPLRASTAPLTRKIASPSPSATNPFFPPLPEQTSVDFHPQLKVLPSPSDPITYYSWHIHVYFFQEDQNVTNRCLSLRQEFLDHFRVPICTGNCFFGLPFDNCTQGMCAWHPFYVVDGPHPIGQWGIFLPNENLAQTLMWLSANHGEFNVLFHPNTGLMVGDNDPGKRAVWIKQQVPLDLDF
jgi:aromatic ring-cleaving dioxygenase